MSSETYPKDPAGLSWDGFLTTMLGIATIIGVIGGAAVALALIALPIFLIYRKCRRNNVLPVEEERSDAELDVMDKANSSD